MKDLNNSVPQDGIAGLKQYWKSDLISGFLVFLIALPLCLGIAKASGFPPISGVFTAIIGGIIVGIMSGSPLTIKGPAAGLIVIVLGAVEELGQGDGFAGYKYALAAIVVAGIVQVGFGLLKTGKLADFFPTSAVHGMLAAIGIIIASKQIHIALGVKPEAKAPLNLIMEIPKSIMNMNPEIALIGLLSAIILFTFPMIKNPVIKKIPAALVVIMVAIPLGYYFDLDHAHDYIFNRHSYHINPQDILVVLPESLLKGITFPDFSVIFSGTSIKYIIMLAMVGSLESLLSSKAIDTLDPFKRKSKMDKDLVAVGIGNTISGFIGALPMISEIVRSSANINNGGKTRWANVFHGIFLLIFVALAASLIHHIPNAALAAMLIYTGYRLASPKEFYKTYKVGPEQLLIFLSTIFVTLATDLLVGIAAGIVTKMIIHFISGVSPAMLFKADLEINDIGNGTVVVSFKNAAVFSNYLGFKKRIEKITDKKNFILDFSKAKVVDHTFMEHLHHFEDDLHAIGGQLEIRGLEMHKPISDHPLASRRLTNVKRQVNKIEFILNPRQIELRKFGETEGYYFLPQPINNKNKFKGFQYKPGSTFLYEENILTRYNNDFKFEVSDIHIREGARHSGDDRIITMACITDYDPVLPTFRLEKEDFWDKISVTEIYKDIDFDSHAKFSSRYLLKGPDEAAIRTFFTPEIIEFFEEFEGFTMQVYHGKVLVYAEFRTLSVDEIRELNQFCEAFMNKINKTSLQPIN
jgi:MFS superfamily sulfate permease-like transporter